MSKEIPRTPSLELVLVATTTFRHLNAMAGQARVVRLARFLCPWEGSAVGARLPHLRAGRGNKEMRYIRFRDCPSGPLEAELEQLQAPLPERGAPSLLGRLLRPLPTTPCALFPQSQCKRPVTSVPIHHRRNRPVTRVTIVTVIIIITTNARGHQYPTRLGYTPSPERSDSARGGHSQPSPSLLRQRLRQAPTLAIDLSIWLPSKDKDIQQGLKRSRSPITA